MKKGVITISRQFGSGGHSNRAKRILEHYGQTEKPIEKRIDDKDTRRKLYYAHYTDRVWGAPDNYHAVLNSGALGEEVCVQIIRGLYKAE